MRPEQSPQTLTPGRGFNSSCLQDPLSFSYTIGYACIVFPNDAVNKPLLLNSTEFFATAANYSRTNQVYLSDGYAVLGPADPSSTVDFQATSFGSKTACRSVTSLCGAKNTGKERWPEPSDFNFICNSSIAGLNMTGNFLNLTQPPGSVELSVSPVYSGPYNPEIAALFVEGNNTITPSSFQIGFQYFKDSQKQAQSPKPDKDYGLDLAQDAHRLFWAVVWTVPFTSSMSGSTDQRDKDTNSVAAVNIAAVNGGGSAGILSCETDISEVVSFPLFFLTRKPYLHPCRPTPWSKAPCKPSLLVSQRPTHPYPSPPALPLNGAMINSTKASSKALLAPRLPRTSQLSLHVYMTPRSWLCLLA